MPSQPYTGQYPVVKKYLEPGDRGTEVTKLQNYLNWYTDGKFFKKYGKADGIYGNNTLRYAKEMQTDFFGASEADGLVGPKTINKMKAYSDSFQPKPEPGTYPGSYPTEAEIYNAQIGGLCQACKDQTSWAYNSVYQYESHPTIAKSKTKGTCVTYVSCVFQRTNDFESGHVLWHDGRGFGDGKVYGANNSMTVTYYNNKKALKDLSLKTGDVLFYDDNKSGEAGNGGHIELFNGTISSGNYYFYSGGCGSYHNTSNKNREPGSRKVLAVARLKQRTYLRKTDKGDAVTKLQNYLNWYFDGAFFKECGGADGIFGANTDKWVKKMQTDFFGVKEADGTVGPKTIAKMKAVRK
jgi:peptidoglycan hydrolase-like protein with peptidoglycan-binding domain